MTASEPELPWIQRQPEAIDLGAPELVYEDELPLSDLSVSPSGAFCCLRRVPGFAEVLVWPGRPSGQPESWTGSHGIPLLDVFGFDGNELYGRTESALLRVRPGQVQTLVQTKAPIYGAGLSPDRGRLFWIEHADKGRLRTMSTSEPASASMLDHRESCVGALWLPEGSLITRQLHSMRGAETGISLLLCTPDLHNQPILETREWLITLLCPDQVPGGFFSVGFRHDFWQPGLAWRRRPDRQVSTWSMRLVNGAVVAECIANAGPAGGTVAVIDGTCLFADAQQQTSGRSVLVAASTRGVKTAEMDAFLRDFATEGSTLFYRRLGSRCGLFAQPLGRLIE